MKTKLVLFSIFFCLFSLSIAPDTIHFVEFIDFQSLSCGSNAPAVDTLKSTYGQQMTITYKHFPEASNTYAQNAAEAAECARDQDKFKEYHDMLFQNQGALTIDDLRLYAISIGLNLTKFNDCLDHDHKESLVLEDKAEGTDRGITGTPTIFINGIKVEGAQSLSTYASFIDSELARTTNFDISVTKSTPSSITIGSNLDVTISITNNEVNDITLSVIEYVFDAHAISPAQVNRVPVNESIYAAIPDHYLWHRTVPASSTIDIDYTIQPVVLGNYSLSPSVVYIDDGSVYSSEEAIVLVNCDKNSLCQGNETALNCPEDCSSGGSDSVCDMNTDGICDPDCPPNIDWDCTCPNSLCDVFESKLTCPADCSDQEIDFILFHTESTQNSLDRVEIKRNDLVLNSSSIAETLIADASIFDLGVTAFQHNLELEFFNVDTTSNTTITLFLDDIEDTTHEDNSFVRGFIANPVFTYENATITFYYDDSEIDEYFASIYRCNDFSNATQECESDWTQICTTIDNSCELNATNNKITAIVSSFSAYGLFGQAVCGDDECTAEESCATCPADCNVCTGDACIQNSDCVSNYCVHSVCRDSSTYCGDTYCDSGESCSECVGDCGKCNGELCTEGNECNGNHCVHSICRSSNTYCGDTHCDMAESCSKCEADCGECVKTDKTPQPNTPERMTITETEENAFTDVTIECNNNERLHIYGTKKSQFKCIFTPVGEALIYNFTADIIPMRNDIILENDSIHQYILATVEGSPYDLNKSFVNAEPQIFTFYIWQTGCSSMQTYINVTIDFDARLKSFQKKYAIPVTLHTSPCMTPTPKPTVRPTEIPKQTIQKKGKGEFCIKADQCLSGHCNNNICCERGFDCCITDEDCDNSKCHPEEFYCVPKKVDIKPSSSKEAKEQIEKDVKAIQEIVTRINSVFSEGLSKELDRDVFYLFAGEIPVEERVFAVKKLNQQLLELSENTGAQAEIQDKIALIKSQVEKINNTAPISITSIKKKSEKDKELSEKESTAMLKLLETDESKQATMITDSIEQTTTIEVFEITYMSGAKEYATKITKIFKNTDMPLEDIIIVATIPKDVAKTVQDITFMQKPSILQNDPVVSWEEDVLFSNSEIKYEFLVKKDVFESTFPALIAKKEEGMKNVVVADSGTSYVYLLLGVAVLVLFIVIIAGAAVYVKIKQDQEEVEEIMSNTVLVEEAPIVEEAVIAPDQQVAIEKIPVSETATELEEQITEEIKKSEVNKEDQLIEDIEDVEFDEKEDTQSIINVMVDDWVKNNYSEEKIRDILTSHNVADDIIDNAISFVKDKEKRTVILPMPDDEI